MTLSRPGLTRTDVTAVCEYEVRPWACRVTEHRSQCCVGEEKYDVPSSVSHSSGLASARDALIYSQSFGLSGVMT